MNREIKFRVWCGYDKKMLKNETLLQRSMTHTVRDKTLTITPMGNDRVIMQFTGLKDKNSVEIYEGDVLQSQSEPGRDWKHRVVFDGQKAGFMLERIPSEDFPPFELTHFDRDWILECDKAVIGNIYEHGHLLEANEKPASQV